MLDATAAAAGWPQARVHAYVGGDPFAGRAVPEDATALESLRSYLVLTFDASDAGPYADAGMRCAAARRVAHRLGSGAPPDFVGWPSPVTPYHADYLSLHDHISRERAEVAAASDATGAPRVRALGETARALLHTDGAAASDDWDATLEEIDAAPGEEVSGPGGWLGSPWRKDGWYAARRLFAGHVHGADARAADAAYRRLEAGEARDDTERVRLERTLVDALTRGCERVVVGYTVRHEYFDGEYSQGVENVGRDSHTGFGSTIFPRTVKLKDFPWNGWLRVGVATRPDAAWNPLGGFGDAFGRLLWSAVGDPALLPAPYGDGFIANRVHVDAASDGPVAIPADALRPQQGTGALVRVGSGRTAAQRLRMGAVMSTFHDGTPMSFADLVYPYVVAARAGDIDPALARASEATRRSLAAFRLVEMSTLTRNYGDDMKFSYREPIVDVYLAQRIADTSKAAAVAPPWSTLPWQLVVLMEEASRRGIAALSQGEAQRRGIPWLDLVRDEATGRKLAALADAFARDGYRPASLASLVTVEEARARWRALAEFHARTGHFLDTNGPYRLKSWSDGGVVLDVFRDASYPVGVGTFDAQVVPLRGYVTAADARADRLDVRAEVERVSRFQRSYALERVAAGGAHAGQDDAQPRCRYVIVAPGGNAVRAGSARFDDAGIARVPLAGLHASGTYTVMMAVAVGANLSNPDVKTVQWSSSSSTP